MIRISPRRSGADSGFTLTELAIVLGVVGLLIGAIWAAASTVFQRQRANDGVMQYKIISDNIRSMYADAKTLPYGSYTDVTATMIATNAGVVPVSMIQNGTNNVLNPEGGAVNIYMIPNSPGATSLQFEIKASTTPKSCSNVLATLAAEATDLNIAWLWDDVHGWQNPANNALDVTSFAGCTSSAATFNLR